MLLLLASQFTKNQISLIVIIAVVFAVILAANALIMFILHYKRKKSKLCTDELQKRREQLLEELANLRFIDESNGLEEEDVDDVEQDDDDNTVEDEDVAADDAVATESEDVVFNAQVLAVKDMTPTMREKLEITGEEFDDKRYYIRVVMGFEARLRLASDEVKRQYREIADTAWRFGKVNVKRSFKQERVSIGRKTIALFTFRGKTLCVALALNPKEYENTKYRGKDMSDKKRFAATPLLIRITSERRLGYVKYLLSVAAKENGGVMLDEYKGMYDLKNMSRNALYNENKIKLVLLGEASEVDLTMDEADDDMDDIEEARVFRAGILSVDSLNADMRRSLGLLGKQFDGKRYYVRYNYSFDAKLRLATDDVRKRYAEFMKEVGLYEKITVRCSAKNIRICLGRRTVAMVLFKGKSLCVAFDLNPKHFADTKFRGIDASEVKRFANTPMILKLTSERRLGYAKYLFNRVAQEKLIPIDMSREVAAEEIAPMNFDELYRSGMIKITVIGEVPANRD